jgi:TRAP-type uncharacterized transport system fused permease subunit
LYTSFVALRISIVGLLVPYVFVFSPSLLLVAGEFSWSELIFTIIRLLAAIWMFSTSLGGADPMMGRLGWVQRAVRFLIGAAAMFPILLLWVPASILAVLVGLFSRRFTPSITSNRL